MRRLLVQTVILIGLATPATSSELQRSAASVSCKGLEIVDAAVRGYRALISVTCITMRAW